MIKIIPTSESGLSAADFAVDLWGELNPNRPRDKKVTTVLSGSVALEAWKKTRAGAVQTIEAVLLPEVFEALNLIVYHASVFDWVVISNNNIFKCEIDYAGEPEDFTFNGDPTCKKVDLQFTVIEDLTEL